MWLYEEVRPLGNNLDLITSWEQSSQRGDQRPCRSLQQLVPLCSLPCDDTTRKQPSKPQREPSPEPDHAHHYLRLPASRTIRSKCLFISHQSAVFCFSSPNRSISAQFPHHLTALACLQQESCQVSLARTLLHSMSPPSNFPSTDSANWLQIPSCLHYTPSWAWSLSPVVIVTAHIMIVLNQSASPS